jgi:hypothetical protein
LCEDTKICLYCSYKTMCQRDWEIKKTKKKIFLVFLEKWLNQILECV